MTPSAAFRADVAGHLPAVSKFARSLTHDPDRADDLAASTMLRALEKESLYEPETKLLAWLFTMTRNIWIDRVRRAQRVHFDSLDLDETTMPPVPPMQDVTVALHEIVDHIAAMPAAARAVIVLVADGMEYETIADTLHLPLGTVRSRLWRARTALREVFP